MTLAVLACLVNAGLGCERHDGGNGRAPSITTVSLLSDSEDLRHAVRDKI